MQVVLNGKKVNVVIHYKKIKNIYFRIDENKNLVISANKWTSEKEIIRLIEKNEASLTRMLNKFEKKEKKEEQFWYLGNPYTIVFDEQKENIEFIDGMIYTPSEKRLDQFIQIETKRIFNEEVENLKKVIKTPPFTLKVRKMKTRWGVCNYKNHTITLNSELIKYKKDDLRYVIIHEMCHFYHHNHGPSFWKMVEYYEPNYKIARKDLRE